MEVFAWDGKRPRGLSLALLAVSSIVGWSTPGMAAEMLPPSAAQAFADMDFPRLKKLLQEDGRSGGCLEACDAMERSFEAACRRLKDGSWKPVLVDMRGKIMDVSRSGLTFRSTGMSMVLPWKTITPLRRQMLLAGAMPRPDREAWLARVTYAVWGNLARRADEEIASAKKAGVELPAWLSLAADLLFEASEPEAPVAAPSRRNSSGSRNSSRSAGGKGQLGSVEFTPSAARPVGWRGDGSGRYPGANPPLEWSRTPKGIYATICSQADKPKTNTASGDLLNMGSIRNWLILGPFAVKDSNGGLDATIVANESSLQPRAGDKLGSEIWKPLNVSISNQSQSRGKLVLDFAFAYEKTEKQEWQNHPGTLEPLAAYAHSYLFSGGDGKVRLRIEGDSPVKAWINGAPVKIPGQWDASPEVQLGRGWNSLVVKSVSNNKAWNFAAHISPAAPVEYETKNVLWMTPMPGTSWCSPTIVGNKLFVNADESTLVCLNKSDGKVLWARNSTFYHAVTPKEREEFPELEATVRQLDSATDQLVSEINGAVSRTGCPPGKASALKKRVDEKCGLEGKIRESMGKKNKHYRIWGNDCCWSTPTPASDGEYVYSTFFGGAKGMGSNVVACFDLKGNRIWSFYTGISGVPEHGNHVSPALCGDTLVFHSGRKLYGFDKKTGKVNWETQTPGTTSNGSSIIPARIGKVDIAVVPIAGIFRASDGLQLWKADFKIEIPTPFLIGDVLIGVDRDFFELKLPATAAMPFNPKYLIKKPWKQMGMHLSGTFSDTIVGSPLYADGQVFIASEGGGLTVVDAATGNVVYTKALDDLNPRLTWVFKVGICSSASMGGKHVFIRDDQSQTLVIEPGPQYKQVAKNVLVELDDRGSQIEAQSNLVFEGDRIYYRTRSYLYCIGEK